MESWPMIKPWVKVGWKNGKLLNILRLRLWAVGREEISTLQVGNSVSHVLKRRIT